MTYPKYIGLLLITAFGLTYLPAAVAQQSNVQWNLTVPISPGVGDWAVVDNWDGGFVPESQFDEVAELQDGTTAQVSTNVSSFPVGGIIIDDFSTVDITATGKLVANFGPSPPFVFGVVDIDSDGTLRVAGELTAESLLNRGGMLRTVGASSLVTVNGDAELGGTITAELTSATHSPIRVAGEAELMNGTLVADFNGATPALGSTWDIVDAGSITGSFGSFEISGASLPSGQGLGVQQVSGGANGNLLQLLIEQKLFLNFDRETKIASIQNVSGAPVSVSLDGYNISSELGSINPGSWDSLQDQGTAGGTWTESAPGSMNEVSEMNTTASSTIAAGGSLDLGTIYSQNFAGAQFNDELEDHEFTYNLNGRSIEGFVTYSGDKQYNNIVLTVDPNSGEGVMQNESDISIEFDAYSIFSPSGSLLTSWDSLKDQGVAGGNWLEANPSTERLSEGMTAFSTQTLDLNEGFNLGTLINGGSQDLTFQFLKAGVPVVIDGVVIYGDLPTVIDPDAGGFNEADFNMDNVVDSLDLAAWEGGYGTSSGAAKAMGDFDNDGDVDGNDFLGWQRNLGAVSVVSASVAVPEPASLVLLVAGVVGLAIRARR